MIPKAAIEKARQGGWKDYLGQSISDVAKELWELHWERTALDPSFWQCLGKALGWTDGFYREPHELLVWQTKAHHFYDLILTDGDTHEFWADLLR